MGLAERSDSLRQPRELPRRRILVHHTPRHAARHLRLRSLQSNGRDTLVTGQAGGFDGLDEGPDAADAGTVDDGAVGVAADALLGLRRVRHGLVYLSQWSGRRKAKGRADVASPYADEANSSTGVVPTGSGSVRN